MMMNSQIAINRHFYEQCAEILCTTHLPTERKFDNLKRTRWMKRLKGDGRFEGRGIIRCFGDQVHIALNNPILRVTCNSKDEALELLNKTYMP